MLETSRMLTLTCAVYCLAVPPTGAGGLRIGEVIGLRDVPIAKSVQLDCHLAEGSTASGTVHYRWSADEGHYTLREGCRAEWHAPPVPGMYTLVLEARDLQSTVKERIPVAVRLPSPRAGAQPYYSERQRPVMVAKEGAAEKTTATAAVESRLRSLRDAIGAPFDPSNPFRNEGLVQELGLELMRAGRYEEARTHYAQVVMQLGGSTRSELAYRMREGYGRAAFFSGEEEEAVLALEDAGPFRTSMGSYYLALLLEKKGNIEAALAMYTEASRGRNRSFPEPLYRRALLLLERGQKSDAVESLIRSSPAIGKRAMIERIRNDDELAPLYGALESTEAISKLEERRELTTERDWELLGADRPQGTREALRLRLLTEVKRTGDRGELHSRSDAIRAQEGELTMSRRNDRVMYVPLREVRAPAHPSDLASEILAESAEPTPENVRIGAIEQSIILEEGVKELRERLRSLAGGIKAHERADLEMLLSVREQQLSTVQGTLSAHIADSERRDARARIDERKRKAATEDRRE